MAWPGRGIAVFIISCGLSLCYYARAYTAEARPRDFSAVNKSLGAYIQARMKKAGIRGVAVALVDGGDLAFAGGYGVADEKKKIPVSADTVFQIGSISKIITAMAVMKLTEEGKIDIDAPLSELLPEFTICSRFPDAGPVTVRSLLTHHSGLPSDYLRGMFTHTRSVPFEEYLAGLLESLKADYLSEPPGAVYSYSNTGFTLVGWLVQKTVGEDFVAYMDREFFQAMNMPGTSYSIDREHPLATKGYLAGREMPLLKINPLPAGSVHSSAREMSNFMKMVLAGGIFETRRILRPETIKSMMTPQNDGTPLDGDFKMGLGWHLTGYDLLPGETLRYEGTVAYHTGDTVLNNSIIMVLPDAGLGVIVLCNTGGAAQVCGDIARHCLDMALAEKTGGTIPERAVAVEPVVELSPEEMKRLEGEYVSEYLGFLSVRIKRGGLYMSVMGHEVRFVPRAGGAFSVKYYLLGIIPVNLERLRTIRFRAETFGDRTVIFVLRNGRRYRVAVKLDRPALSDIWKERLGKYRLRAGPDDVILLGEFELSIRYGYLLCTAAGATGRTPAIVFPLRPVSEEACIIMGLGRYMGQTVRFTRIDGAVVMTFSGATLVMDKGKK